MIHNFYDWDDTIVLTRPAIYLSYSFALKKVVDIDLPRGDFDKKLYANANAYMAQLGFTPSDLANSLAIPTLIPSGFPSLSVISKGG